MQKSKTFVGSIGAYNTSTSRPYIYGLTSTDSMSIIATDFLCSTIADFLANDCGVDAAYEVRSGDSNKWLWVYGMPFLPNIKYNRTATATSISSPYGGSSNACFLYNGSSTIFNSYSTGDYNFTLYYYGNPEDVCVLYIKGNYGTSGTGRFCVLKTKNLVTGGSSVTALNQNSSSGIYAAYDLDTSGALVWDSSIAANAYPKGYTNILNLQYPDASKNSGKLPLVNMVLGIHYCEHAFLTPNADMVPAGVTIGTLVQPEFTVGDRTFINFANWGSAQNTNAISSVSSAFSSSYTNLGLVEVTGT